MTSADMTEEEIARVVRCLRFFADHAASIVTGDRVTSSDAATLIERLSGQLAEAREHERNANGVADKLAAALAEARAERDAFKDGHDNYWSTRIHLGLKKGQGVMRDGIDPLRNKLAAAESEVARLSALARGVTLNREMTTVERRASRAMGFFQSAMLFATGLAMAAALFLWMVSP